MQWLIYCGIASLGWRISKSLFVEAQVRGRVQAASVAMVSRYPGNQQLEGAYHLRRNPPWKQENEVGCHMVSAPGSREQTGSESGCQALRPLPHFLQQSSTSRKCHNLSKWSSSFGNQELKPVRLWETFPTSNQNIRYGQNFTVQSLWHLALA